MKVIIKDREMQIDEKYGYLLDFCKFSIRGGYALVKCTYANLFIFQDFGHNHGQNISFHRLLYEIHGGSKLGKDEKIDHINGDKLDNRISNLRILTSSQNNKNKKLKDGQIYYNISYIRNENYFVFQYSEVKIIKIFKELKHAIEYFIKYDNENDNILTKSIYNRKPIEEIENIVLEPNGYCENCEKTLWSNQTLKRHKKNCKKNS